ncbi:hypothetical protein MRX96_020688 [Rhipicephalus microplus]
MPGVAAAAWRDGLVHDIRQQLEEARREAAELRVRVALAGALAPGRSFEDVLDGRNDGTSAPPTLSEPPCRRGPFKAPTFQKRCRTARDLYQHT